jgi:hypothetical protein
LGRSLIARFITFGEILGKAKQHFLVLILNKLNLRLYQEFAPNKKTIGKLSSIFENRLMSGLFEQQKKRAFIMASNPCFPLIKLSKNVIIYKSTIKM